MTTTRFFLVMTLMTTGCRAGAPLSAAAPLVLELAVSGDFDTVTSAELTLTPPGTECPTVDEVIRLNGKPLGQERFGGTKPAFDFKPTTVCERPGYSSFEATRQDLLEFEAPLIQRGQPMQLTFESAGLAVEVQALFPPRPTVRSPRTLRAGEPILVDAGGRDTIWSLGLQPTDRSLTFDESRALRESTQNSEGVWAVPTPQRPGTYELVIKARRKLTADVCDGFSSCTVSVELVQFIDLVLMP